MRQDVSVLYGPTKMTVINKIIGCNRGGNSFNFKRGVCIQFDDIGMRHGAVEHFRVQHPRQSHIANIFGIT